MSLWATLGSGSRLAAAGAGSNAGRAASSSRVTVVAQARSGYEPRRPSRPPSQPAGAWDMEEDEDDLTAGRPANNQAGQQGAYRPSRQYNPNNNSNVQGGENAQNGDYRPRRQYNRGDGQGQYNRGDGRGQYNRRDGQGQYNRGDGQGQYNRGDGQGQYRRTGQYNPDGSRRQYAPRGDGGDEGQQGRQPRSYINPRQSLSPEMQAARDETNRAVRNVKGYQAIAALLQERSSMLDAENVSILFQKISREPRPQDPNEAAAFDGVLSALLGWAISLMPTYRPRQTARTLVALGKMQLYSPEVVTGLVEKAAEQIGNCDDQDACSMIEALAALGQVPSEAFQTQFFMRTKGRFTDMKLLDIGVMLNSMTKLGMHTAASPEWVQNCFTLLKPKLLALPQSAQAHNALKEAFYEGAREQGGRKQGGRDQEGKESDATAQQQEPQQEQRQQRRPQRYFRQGSMPADYLTLEQYVELVMAIAQIVKDTGYQPEQEFVDALFTTQGWRLQSDRWSALLRVLWSATNLTARPHPSWVGAIDRALASNDRRWDTDTLPQLCLYFSRYLGAAVSPLLRDRLARYLDANRPLLGVEGMAPILFTLGTSGYRPSDERWLDSVLIYLTQNMASCSVTSLELLYTVLPNLGEGYRLNQVHAEIANRYAAAVQQTQEQYVEAPQQEGEAAAATAA